MLNLKRCDGKNSCNLNINLDFPLEYAVENFQGQLLNISYKCTTTLPRCMFKIIIVNHFYH